MVNRKQIAAAAKTFHEAIEVEMNQHQARPTEEFEPQEAETEVENPMAGGRSRPVSSFRHEVTPTPSRPVSTGRTGMHGGGGVTCPSSFNATLDVLMEEEEL